MFLLDFFLFGQFLGGTLPLHPLEIVRYKAIVEEIFQA